MSLKNVCFEQIKDNFYYGQFGEFKLVIDKNTGCFNATKLCKLGDKKYNDWFRLEKTKNLIEILNKNCYGNSRSINYEIKPGNKSKINQKISGTYLCKELILDIASWVSPEFYLKCNNIIINHFEKEYQNTIKQKDDKIDELFKRLDLSEKKAEQYRIKSDEKHKELMNTINNQTKEIKELYEQNEEILEKLDEVQEDLNEANNKLDITLPDRNITPDKRELVHHYILFKSKDIDNEYKFIRGQERHINLKKSTLSNNYDIKLDSVENPNPIDLANRLKDRIDSINEIHINRILSEFRNSEKYRHLPGKDKRRELTKLKKSNILIDCKRNRIILKNYTEDNFINLIKTIDDEKYDI